MTIDEMMNSIDEDFQIDPKVEEFTNRIAEFASELPEVDKDFLSESTEDEPSDINITKFYDLCESVQEYFENVSEAAEELEISTVLETTSKEMLNEYKSKKKEYKECIKTIKKSIKSGDVATAKKSLKDAQDIISDFEKLIKSYDTEHQNDSFSQSLLSSWYATTAQLGEVTVELLKFFGTRAVTNILISDAFIAKLIANITISANYVIKSTKVDSVYTNAEKNKIVKSKINLDSMTAASIRLLDKMKETLSKLESNLRVKEKKSVKESFDLYDSDLFGFPRM